MRLHRLALAAALLLPATLALPSQARVPHLPELTADTTVTASHSGWVDVVVPEDARLSVRSTGNPDTGVAGAGRFVGVFLDRLDPDTTGPSTSDFLSVVRYPSFLGSPVVTSGSTTPAGECRPVPSAQLPVTSDCTDLPAGKAVLLHEGRYRVVVLADGSPVTFSLSLHGLDAGRTSVAVAHALRSAEVPMTQRETLQDKVVTFGATTPVFPANYTWVLSAAKGVDSGTVDERGGCSRRDVGAPPPYAFSPTCPGGDGGSYQVLVSGQTQRVGVVGAGGSTQVADAATTMSLGGSYGGESGRAFVAGLGVWMEYPG